jgi:hypothetical protein
MSPPPVATRRQVNAIAAFLVTETKTSVENAGAVAAEMLTLCGYDMSQIEHETVDRRTPVLYTGHDDNDGGPS